MDTKHGPINPLSASESVLRVWSSPWNIFCGGLPFRIYFKESPKLTETTSPDPTLTGGSFQQRRRAPRVSSALPGINQLWHQLIGQNTQIKTQAHVYIHVDAQASALRHTRAARSHTHTHARAHALNACSHARMNAHTCTYAHTIHTCTHTPHGVAYTSSIAYHRARIMYLGKIIHTPR